MMSLRGLLTATMAMLLGVVTPGSVASTDPVYRKGDCITPTDQSHPWYGRHAEVRAFARIEGVADEEIYIIAFRYHPLKTVLTDRGIEIQTVKVDGRLCRRWEGKS